MHIHFGWEASREESICDVYTGGYIKMRYKIGCKVTGH